MTSERQPFFQWLAGLIRRDDLTPATKLVAIALRDRLGQNGECWPGESRVSKDTALSLGAVKAAVKRLEERGVLEVTRTAGKVNAYRFKQCTSTENEPVQKTDGTGSENGREPGQKMAPNLQSNPPKNQKVKRDDEAKGILAAYAEVKPAGLDQSRSRAAGHVRKLLGKHPAEKLLRAVSNYRAEVEAAGTEPKYRRGCGNFFGRDGDWQTYADSGWTLPAEASDDEPPPLDPEMIEALESRAAGGGR